MNEMHTVNQSNSDTKIYFYIALIFTVIGGICLPLCFTPLGIYALIAGGLCELCALALIEKQKKVNPVKQIKIIKTISYCVLAVILLIFIGGIIYVSTL